MTHDQMSLPIYSLRHCALRQVSCDNIEISRCIINRDGQVLVDLKSGVMRNTSNNVNSLLYHDH